MTPDAPDLPARWPGDRPPTTNARRCGSPTASCSIARPRASSPSASACRRSRDAVAEYDTVIDRRRTGRDSRRPSTALRRACARRGRARGARRPGRHLVAHRELPRLSERRVGRRAREPRAAAGEAPRRRDPGHALGRRASTRRRGRCILDGDDVDQRPHHHPRHRRDVAAAGDRRLRPADRQGHLLRRGAQRGERHARRWTST